MINNHSFEKLMNKNERDETIHSNDSLINFCGGFAIKNNSNLNMNSFSKLEVGNYQWPIGIDNDNLNSYLVGSPNFKCVEIETFLVIK